MKNISNIFFNKRILVYGLGISGLSAYNFLKKKRNTVELTLKDKKPTIPSTIEEEIKTNIFFKLNDPDVKKAINLENSSDIEIFTKLRDLKDNF